MTMPKDKDPGFMPEILETPSAPSIVVAPARRAKPKEYWLVNPAGAIHSVSREHAKERMKNAGWRIATPAEVEELKRRKGIQLFDDPICKPWSPDPEPDAPLE
jgi:hypothetical protein